MKSEGIEHTAGRAERPEAEQQIDVPFGSRQEELWWYGFRSPSAGLPDTTHPEHGYLDPCPRAIQKEVNRNCVGSRTPPLLPDRRPVTERWPLSLVFVPLESPRHDNTDIGSRRGIQECRSPI